MLSNDWVGVGENLVKKIIPKCSPSLTYAFPLELRKCLWTSNLATSNHPPPHFAALDVLIENFAKTSAINRKVTVSFFTFRSRKLCRLNCQTNLCHFVLRVNGTNRGGWEPISDHAFSGTMWKYPTSSCSLMRCLLGHSHEKLKEFHFIKDIGLEWFEILYILTERCCAETVYFSTMSLRPLIFINKIPNGPERRYDLP